MIVIFLVVPLLVIYALQNKYVNFILELFKDLYVTQFEILKLLGIDSIDIFRVYLKSGF